MPFTQKERQEILSSLRTLVPQKHINVSNPNQDYTPWVALLDSRRAALENTESVDEFEAGVRELLDALGSSHTAFFREGAGVPPVHAINATLRAVPNGDGADHWMFLDVIEDGPAHVAGIKPGELLTRADGSSIRPPVQPFFNIGGQHKLEIIGLNGATRAVTIDVPNRAAKDRPPMVEPRSITHRMLTPNIGYLKVATFPGAIGSGFARALDGAMVDLKQHGCDRLIIDPPRQRRRAVSARCA